MPTAFLNLGKENFVNISDIISIVKYENVSSDILTDTINKKNSKNILLTNDKNILSVIYMRDGTKFLSGVSSSTLMNRIK